MAGDRWPIADGRWLVACCRGVTSRAGRHSARRPRPSSPTARRRPTPGGIGVSPFVTIAALAERTMARVLVEDSAP
ncbi:hypothetical protein ACWD3J_05235 [Streptomyces sp. NPDC002755]